MTAKTRIADVDRGVYDIINLEHHKYVVDKGLTEDIIKEISRDKGEPQWMLDFRLESLSIYKEMPVPTWGADLTELDVENIVHYVRPDTEMAEDWDDVPEDIKMTFERLGIPQAERESLAGVGAQYDSDVVYHSLQQELIEQGVIYTDMDKAVRDYPDMVKEYFMTVITNRYHKFAALHGAVWSGGSFVYVPKGVKVEKPLQSYFRLNAKGAGQFEHTLIIVDEGADLHFIEGCSAPKYSVQNLHAGAVELIVRKDAKLRYSTIENWSRNMYNLNTKLCLVDQNGTIEWVSGSFGSRVSMLYPTSVLRGEGAKSEFTGITFASTGQYLDTGTKVIHAAPNTSSIVNSKSISKDGGHAYYRGFLKVTEDATGSKSAVNCESLMLDDRSISDTLPIIEVYNDDVDIGHEARIGRISDETIFYLMSRGIPEEEAKAMIVRGFVEPITKELPLEYAVELNNLITLELEGTIG